MAFFFDLSLSPVTFAGTGAEADGVPGVTAGTAGVSPCGGVTVVCPGWTGSVPVPEGVSPGFFVASGEAVGDGLEVCSGFCVTAGVSVADGVGDTDGEGDGEISGSSDSLENTEKS